MLKYIIRRALYGILVLIGVVILVFFLFQGIGDPSRLVMGQSGDSFRVRSLSRGDGNRRFPDAPLAAEENDAAAGQLVEGVCERHWP